MQVDRAAHLAYVRELEAAGAEPALCAAPWPEHVVASEYWHRSPTQPESHEVHVPSLCAVPRPEHVVASECRQAARTSYVVHDSSSHEWHTEEYVQPSGAECGPIGTIQLANLQFSK